MINNIATWLMAGTMVMSTTLAASPHSSATGVVKERMDGMMMLGNQIKLLNPMLSGAVPIDTVAIGTAAEMIAQHAGSAMLDLFPEGSIQGPSDARQEIWSRWQEFEALALKLKGLGDELAETVSTSANAPVVAVASVPRPPVLSEWEQLDIAVLLGTKTRAQRQEELIPIPDNLNTASTLPVRRSPAVVFADISANCSACHSAFRR